MTTKTPIGSERKAQLESVKAWIVKACPERKEHRFLVDNRVPTDKCMYCDEDSSQISTECTGEYRPIRLADVLRALGMAGVHTKYGDWELKGTVDGYGCFYSEDGKPLGNWDLAHDDLSQQSESVISFLSHFCDGHE